jgi:hypothetical protein
MIETLLYILLIFVIALICALCLFFIAVCLEGAITVITFIKDARKGLA